MDDDAGSKRRKRKKAMDDDAGFREFPTDVLVEILLRLPTSSRRRCRLVCRLWRDAVDDHTTEMRSRAKVLFWNDCDSVAYVVDDLSSSCTELWSLPDGRRSPYGNTQLVATCNGLLCLCDNAKMPGGAITLVNPATGEALPVPPRPFAGMFDGIDSWNRWDYENWDEAYTFGYQPISRQYKVVHVPCTFHLEFNFNSVQVLTLGEASWREVSPGLEGEVRRNSDAGIISVDGTTYWATEGSTPRVVSLDLEHERITSCTPLPVVLKKPDFYHLTEVNGKLGVVILDQNYSVATNVWILEKGRWSHRYSLSFPYESLPRPLVMYGEYVLTSRGVSLYKHYTGKGPSSSSDVVWVSQQDRKTLVAKVETTEPLSGTFAYVETTEPLSVYATN